MVPILQNYNSIFFSFTPKQTSFNLQYEIVCKMLHITMQLTVST